MPESALLIATAQIMAEGGAKHSPVNCNTVNSKTDCAASKKAKSGAARKRGAAQLRAETSENHTRRRQKKHGNAESDVFGLLAGHRFDQQGEKGTRRFEEHFNMWIACNKASRHNLDSPSKVNLLNAS